MKMNVTITATMSAMTNEPAMIAMSLPLLDPEGWGPIGPPGYAG